MERRRQAGSNRGVRPSAEALLASAQAAEGRGDFAEAIKSLSELLRLRPRDSDVLRRLGLAEIATGEVEQGKARLEVVARQSPMDVRALHALALALKRQGRFADALRWLDKAAGVAPDALAVGMARADVLSAENRFEEALKALEPWRGKAEAAVHLAVPASRALSQLGRHDEAIALLEDGVRLSSSQPGLAREIAYRLGQTLDRAGRFDEAFAAMERATSMGRSGFDPTAHARAVEAAISSIGEDLFDGGEAGDASSAHVFIVGIPRSGTTLIEQMLSCHKDVVACGELTFWGRAAGELRETSGAGQPLVGRELAKADVTTLRREHQAFIERHVRNLGGKASKLRGKTITDKNPLNYLHLPLIARVRPNAKVIYCRRDPLDTCLSCWFTLFPHLDFTERLAEHLGAYHVACERLMDHWREVVPLDAMEVRYEDVVAETEREARRIVEFIGLDWTDEVLRFHEHARPVLTASVNQVARPIYASSVGRHRHYERHLGPLRETLHRLG